MMISRGTHLSNDDTKLRPIRLLSLVIIGIRLQIAKTAHIIFDIVNCFKFD